MRRLTFIFRLPLFFCVVILSCQNSGNEPIKTSDHESLNRQGTQWAPFIEWSLKNPDYKGNPFDITGWIIFTHRASKEVRRTQMFFAGNNVWKFRFTGTKVGIWDFVTESDQPNLNGRTGIVEIHPNKRDHNKGFLTTHHDKFARQVGTDGDLKAVLLNVYHNGLDWTDFSDGGYGPSKLDRKLDEVLEHGCNAIFLFVANSWFKFGAKSHREHRSDVPDLKTFEKLEYIITRAYERGFHIHIWKWGDEERKWTPIGVDTQKRFWMKRPFKEDRQDKDDHIETGGINGVPDKRLQRYIAARLGPLPGWSMSYGFDLEEWVSEEQVGEWAEYLHEHMGWPHLLMARGIEHSKLDVRSISHYGTPKNIPRSFMDVVKDMDHDKFRPNFYEERFLHKRWNYFTMDVTRRHMWWYAMAGGMGGFWGVMWNTGPHYPNPEQMRTHKNFWDERFLLKMERANNLTDGYALKNPDNKNLVFYKEDAELITMDLSSLPTPLPAIAVDAKKEYLEIDMGTLDPGSRVLELPYISDWAIAIGNFKRH